MHFILRKSDGDFSQLVPEISIAVRRYIMKKILCMVIVAAMLLSMTGAAYGAVEPANKVNRQFGFSDGNSSTLGDAAGATSAKVGNFISGFYKIIQQAKSGNTQSSQSNSGTSATGDQTGSTNLSVSSKSSQVVSLVNEERKKAGLTSLKTDSQLTKLAQLKAEDMAKNKYFSHTSPTYGSAFNMMKTYGVAYKTAGENIAKGQKTATAVMNGWMNSQGHKANILSSKFTSIGVGYATDGNGTAYWVQIFKG